MESVGFTFWEEDGGWLGYLDEYPDYVTQGADLADLKAHLRDLHQDLSAGLVPAACGGAVIRQFIGRSLACRPTLPTCACRFPLEIVSQVDDRFSRPSHQRPPTG